MYIPKSNYSKKETAHSKDTIKDVILDKTHLQHLLQFAKSYFKKGQILESHSHDSMSEVFYVERGKVKVHINDNEFTAQCGDSFYIKAKSSHCFEFLEETELIYFCLEDF
jgi:quercetin dioxygenase-like cupin family protein